MTKKLILTLSALLILTAMQAQQRIVADRIVAVVGNSAIFYSEVVDYSKQLQQQRREKGYTSDRNPLSESLEALMMQKLLYNQALVDSVSINNGAVLQNIEDRVAQMTREAGSIGALEASYNKPLYEIKDDLRRQIEEAQYAQSMRSTVMNKVKVTPGEVEKYYRSLKSEELPIIPEQYVYAQITKFPSSTTAAKQRTRERLLEMRERVIGGTRFDMLARMYSEDTQTAIRGGEMEMTLEQLVKPFADALAKLQPGQVSGVVETEYGFHIIQLVEKKGNVYKCRHILLHPQFTDEEIAGDLNYLDSLAGVIRSGKTTFEEAAVQYSDDKYSKQNGGLVTNHEMLEFYGANDTSYSRTAFYKEDLGRDWQAIRGLKTGEISTAFQTQDLRNNTLCKVIKLLDVIPSHSAGMSHDYLQLEEVALQDKQQKEFERWLVAKIDAMYVRINAPFDISDFENKSWVK